MPESLAQAHGKPDAVTGDPFCHVIRDKNIGQPSSDQKFCHVLRDKPAERTAGDPEASVVVLELRVRNHPGAMSHITGLFARRAFNLEAIICVPHAADAGATSRMLLLVANEPRLLQVERQLARLHDVLAIHQRADLDRGFFMRFAG